MGQEFSCAQPRKHLEDSFDAVCEGVDRVADKIEHALDEVTKSAPARPFCNLSDQERLAAHRWFDELRHQQGREFERSAPVVFEDALMAACLDKVGLLGPVAADMTEAHRVEPALEKMQEKLHAIPVGHWLRADPGRKGYDLNEWFELISRLCGPYLVMSSIIGQNITVACIAAQLVTSRRAPA